MTHTVSIKGELVDHWTIDDPQPCGDIGGGTLTVKFQTQRLRVLPFIDPLQRNGKGSWIIGFPLGKRGIRDAPYIKSTGTITRVDNTVRRPSSDGTPCPPSEKFGCGTSVLRKPKGKVERHDRRRVAVRLATERYDLLKYGSCLTGSLFGWSTPHLSGGTVEGHLLARMPKPSTLKRRRKVVVNGSSHKRTVSTDRLNPGSETITDDVTRKVTITFKRR
jgi:hypothetical protein